MSTPAPPTPPTQEEIAQAVENVGNTVGWIGRIIAAIKAAFRKPPSPPAVAALLALVLPVLSCTTAQIGAIGAGLAGAGTLIKIVGSVHVPPPPGQVTATPTAGPTPILSCDRDLACGCWACVDTPDQRRAIGAPSAVCMQPYYVPCAPQATATPTSSPTATRSPAPTAGPTVVPIPTAAPTMPPAPAVACLVLESVPREAVRAIQSGPCRPGFRRLDYDGGHLCMANWSCADGDDSKNCPNKIGPDINSFHNLTPDPVDGFVHDGEHPRTDAFCRNLYDDGRIIYPGPEPDGYVPAPWERAGVCRPVICAPLPTAAPPMPTMAPPAPPAGPGGSCRLPRGDGPGLDCPRTSQRLLAVVMDAVNAVVTLYPDMLEPGSDVVRVGLDDAFRLAVVDQLRGGGLCAFFDGEEIAVKNSNAFSEQYAVLSSSRNIRRGEGSYRATCTPAWSAIPPSSEAVAAPPLLVLVRVGDHCSNPADGNRYLVRHECVVDTTAWYRDPAAPEDVKNDSSCDPDHLGWKTLCHGASHDDPRGVEANVTGAESWGRDGDNPQQIVVTFVPGQEFTVCVHPFADVHDADGTPIPVRGSAEQCRSQRHE